MNDPTHLRIHIPYPETPEQLAAFKAIKKAYRLRDGGSGYKSDGETQTLYPDLGEDKKTFSYRNPNNAPKMKSKPVGKVKDKMSAEEFRKLQGR